MTQTPLPALFHRRMFGLILRHGSQKGLADHLGMSQAQLSNIIAGRATPPPRLLAEMKLRRVVTKTVHYELAQP